MSATLVYTIINLNNIWSYKIKESKYIKRGCQFGKIGDTLCGWVEPNDKDSECHVCDKDFCNACSGANEISLHIWMCLYSFIVEIVVWHHA